MNNKNNRRKVEIYSGWVKCLLTIKRDWRKSNMKNYEKIPFNEIDNIESYMEEKLRDGHVIIQILVNEDKKEIDELISYANDKECKSYYRSLTDSDEQLKTSVISEMLEPYYKFKDSEESENEEMCDIDIETDSQNVIDFSTFKKDFRSMEEYYSEKRSQIEGNNIHYEFYESIEKGNIGDFGGHLEIDFITEWMAEQGYYSK